MVRPLQVPFVIILALVAAAAVRAQQPQLPIADGQVLRLWEGSAPVLWATTRAISLY
jgi:hypothetical protein